MVGRWWGWGCDDVFCGCYCAWGVRYLMILRTLMDSGGGKGERAGVGFKRGGVWKRQFGNEIKRYCNVVAPWPHVTRRPPSLFLP